MNIEIALYDGFDELDAIAPYEVFANAVRFSEEGSVRLVTADAREEVTASHGLRVGVDGELGTPDLLLVPGGGWNDRSRAGAWSEAESGVLPEEIGRLYEARTTLAGVCTGGMLLATAGVLDGVPAVTHASALDDLRETGADVRDARVVDTGRVLTAGGVTSGLDLAFHVVAREWGPEVAARVASEMEYTPSDDVLVV
ncbi:DJ-1/PfpI family protein [Natronomonas sp. EA1]|uniref:DJ-1/PfpI family protein n=1 Tax=Natronomonas sp. EA1 TaxID=3421655 RepID=UPI003EB82945